jgi:hypothetical protein
MQSNLVSPPDEVSGAAPGFFDDVKLGGTDWLGDEEKEWERVG